jgi:hypothetical protein
MKYKLTFNIEIDNTEITGDSSYITIAKQTKYGPMTIKLPATSVETIEKIRSGKLEKIYNKDGWEINKVIQNNFSEKKHSWGDTIEKEINRRIELENRIERKETEISMLYNKVKRLENIIEHSTLDTSF